MAAADLLDDSQDRLCGCVVEPLDRGRRRRRTESRQQADFQVSRVRAEGDVMTLVGDEGMGGHISADFCGVFPSTLHQFTGTVFHSRFGAFGLGVTK